jgi:hypothetical protein
MTSSTGRRHENAPRSYRLRASRRLRDSLCAARLARMYVAVRQFARTAQSRNGGMLHARPTDGDRWSRYDSISGYRRVLRAWRVVRDLSMAARAFGSNAVRCPGVRRTVLPAQSRCVVRTLVQEPPVNGDRAEDDRITLRRDSRPTQAYSIRTVYFYDRDISYIPPSELFPPQ